MATQHNFRIKNGLEVGGVLIVNSSGQLQATTISGAISATSIGVTNIVTNKVVKFNGTILDDSNITDTGSLITLGSNTAVGGTISTTGKITVTNANFNNHIAIVRGSANMGLSPSGNELLVIGGGFAPDSNNSYNLGRSDKIWANVFAYNYKIGGTTVINSSRNLLNIGTISSGILSVNGGTSNVVATFQSTDGTAGIKLQDSAGNVELSASGSTFQVQPSGGSAVFTVNSSGVITATGGNSTNWNTAYGWGNHASAGYLTSSSTQSKYLRSDTNDSFTGGELTISSTSDRGLVLNRNIANPANYYNGLQMEVRATSGTAGIGLHRNGYSHVGIYHDTSNRLDFDFNSGDVIMNHNAGTLWGSGNDGANSGLDADLLDGQHGSHYLNYNNFTNTPTIPSLSGYATESYVGTQISNLVDSSPAALNTLNELAAAIGDDANFSTTVTNNIATKLPIAGGTMTGTLNAPRVRNGSSGELFLGNFNTSNTDQWPLIGFVSGTDGTTGTWDDGFIKGSSARGRFSKAHMGIHFDDDRSFAFHTSGWDTEMEINGDGRIYLKGPVGINTTPSTSGAVLQVEGTASFTNTITGAATDATSLIVARSTGNGEKIHIGGWTTANSSNIHRIRGSSNLHIDSADGGDIYLNYYNSNNPVLIQGANVAWHAGNDGSGSGLDADLLDGQHGSYYTNPTSLPANGGNADTVDNMHFHTQLGVGEKIDFTVGGDAATYYPVVISGGGGERVTDFQIFRSYAETAPSSWGSSTHMGGLTFNYKIMGSSGWGGYPTGIRVQEFGEIYRRILGGIAFTAHSMKHVVWLRGGTATYHIWSNADISIQVNDSTSASNYVSASPHKWYSYNHSNAAYDVTVSERTSAEANTGVANEVYLNMPVSYNSAGTPSVYGIATSAYNHKFWNSSNDGSGSGLDADLLDGINSSQFVRNDITNGINLTITGVMQANNGYKVNSNTVIDSNRNITAGTVAGTTADFSGAVQFQGTAAIEGGTAGSGYGVFKGYAPNDNHFIAVRGAVATGQSTPNLTGAHQTTFVEHAENNDTTGWYWKSRQTGTYQEIARLTRTGGFKRAGSQVWDASNDGSGSGLDADLLDGVQGASFLRSDANDTATGQYTFSKVSDHAIRIGTIRGTVVGSQSGEYIHMYNRVHIGSPSGWGSRSAPTYGLSTYGGADFATDTGSVTISGSTAWHAGNDGSGSGLDADTLDGQHASAFLTAETLSSTNTVTVTGTKYFKPAGSATSPLGGGGGSSLQAYAPNNGTAAYMAFHRSSQYAINWGLDTSNTMVLGGWSSSTTVPRMSIGTNGLMVTAGQGNLWGAGNDGSGSGLDADLLDGIQASGFLQAGGSWNASNMPGSRHVGISVNGGEVVFQRDNPGSGRMSIMVDGQFYAGENGGFYSLYSGNNYNNKVGFKSNSSGNLEFTSAGTESKFTTAHGFIQLGPMNSSYAHIYTDRGSFYFNKTDLYANGNIMWTAGNDGSGSGLDADTLDGTHLASIYSNSAVANASVNKVYENATITYGASYLQWTDNNGTGGAGTNGAAPGNPFSDWHHHIIQNHGNSGGYYVDIASCFHSDRIHFRRNTNGNLSSWRELWHTGNDGSGSGLDADLLDGYNAEEGAVNNSIVKRDGSASIKAHGLSLMRVSTATTGISWYNESYYNWQDYMAAAGATSCGPNGNLTAPTGLSGVTSWALRSRMEGVSTYGWNWETGGGGGGGATATSKMSLNATTGNLALVGTVSASGFYDQNSSGFYVDPASSTNLQSVTSTPALKVTQTNAGGNNIGSLFQNSTGNFAWGCIAEYRIAAATGTDRPSIIFSSAYNSDTWTTGFGYTDSNFRIKKDHGHRNGGWGTSLMTMDRSGNVTFAGNVTAYSDERLKTEIKTIENPLDTISKLRGVTFKWKESGDDSMGVIAQEVEAIAETKCLVSETPEDGNGDINPKNVAYGNMVGLLIEGMKEQQTVINRLVQDIKDLKEQIK